MNTNTQYSNIKNWPAGVITYTVETALWRPKSDTLQMDRGWGNGYICIPTGHPYIQRCKDRLKEELIAKVDAMDGLGYLGAPTTIYDMVIPHPEQEWTFGEHVKAEEMAPELNPLPGTDYYIIGFDCNHAWNTEANSPESKVVQWIEEYVPIVNQ